jgi:2-iminobutanoate/2-iminopropanoate deaminase
MTQSSRAWEPVVLPADAPQPAGAYSPAIRAGHFVFVSGQVPKDPRTGRIVEGGVAAQTRQVLANAARVLDAADSSLDDVVSVTAYLADIDDWAAFDEVWRDAFSPPYPTRTTLGASLHGFLVEISLVAYTR